MPDLTPERLSAIISKPVPTKQLDLEVGGETVTLHLRALAGPEWQEMLRREAVRRYPGTTLDTVGEKLLDLPLTFYFYSAIAQAAYLPGVGDEEDSLLFSDWEHVQAFALRLDPENQVKLQEAATELVAPFGEIRPGAAGTSGGSQPRGSPKDGRATRTPAK